MGRGWREKAGFGGIFSGLCTVVVFSCDNVDKGSDVTVDVPDTQFVDSGFDDGGTPDVRPSDAGFDAGNITDALPIDSGFDSGGTDAGSRPCDPDCPATDIVQVPAGSFWMGCDFNVDNECGQWWASEKPYHQVTLSDFWMDTFETTFSDYEKCVRAGACTLPYEPPIRTEPCVPFVPEKQNHPLNLTWEQAGRYCQWVGKRLPTEAEWEKAARGTDGRTLPWGNGTHADCDHAVVSNGCGTGDTLPVGSKPLGVSPYGIADMLGNVREWAADWFDENYYQSSPSRDPQGPASGSQRVVRGGGFTTSSSDRLTVSRRGGVSPSTVGAGVRCASSVLMTAAIGGADAGQDSAAGCEPSCDIGEMVAVPASPFWMGCNKPVDNECEYGEEPYHEVTLSGFEIDKYEVTASQYKGCVDSGGCWAPDTGGACTYGVSGKEAHPVNCVDWCMAQDYCLWAGKRLPTEAEWEKAARGTDGRKYPWGNTPKVTCEHAVMVDPSGGSAGCGTGGPMAVGSKPAGASPYGAEDMIGNVWEWLSDYYDPNYYQVSPQNDPPGSASTTWGRAVRGGSWNYVKTADLRASKRIFSAQPVPRHAFAGIRCAR